jgi:hypothetical protein
VAIERKENVAIERKENVAIERKERGIEGQGMFVPRLRDAS